MRLQSLDLNKTYKRRKSHVNPSRDTFEYTPRLVQPEFNIPIIKNQEDQTTSMEFSGIINYQSDTQNYQESKVKRSNSNSLSRRNISFVKDHEKYSHQVSDNEIETFHQIKMDFNSENNIGAKSPNDTVPQIKDYVSLSNIKYYQNKKRQSKYFNDKDSEHKLRVQSVASRDFQQEATNNQENTLKMKSNFSQIPPVLEQLTNIQKIVITIGFVYTFFIKLKNLSGISSIFNKSKNDSARYLQNIEQMRLLNDLSLANEKKQQQSKYFNNNNISQSFNSLSKIDKIMKKNSISLIQSILKKIPVVHPNSTKLFFWDITNFIFIILNLVYIPIETVVGISFLDQYGKKWTFFIFISISVYIFSILLSTNLGYYDKGYCIMDRDKILKRYMKLGFWLDVLSTLPIFISTLNAYGYVKFFNLLVILKIQWIDKFFGKYLEIFTLKKQLYHNIILRFFYIILKVLFFAHCYACIFLALAFHLDESQTWVTKYGNGLLEKGWFTKYVYAFYWGITTMTTVGLGDLLPSNIYEVGALTLFMFVSCGTFAYSFNEIGMILEELKSKSDVFTKEMRLVTRYLQTKNVDQNLQLEVRKYIEYKFDFENEISIEEEKMVFSKLSSQIQEKIVISTNMILLKNCKFLHDNFSEEFLMKLCLQMESESKLNKEIIYSQDEVYKENLNNTKFYILESGSVQILVSSSNNDQPIVIRNIKRGDDFGSLEFFNDNPRHYTSQAIGSTRLLSIDRNKFVLLLKYFPQDYERFMMLVENSKMNKNIAGLKLICYCCQQTNHSLKECPGLHYIANRELSILKKMFSHPQKREKYERYQRLKINSLFEIPIIQERAKYFYDPDESQEECPSPQTLPFDEIKLQHSPNHINLRQTHIPSSEYKDLDSPDKIQSNNYPKLFRQSSIISRIQQQSINTNYNNIFNFNNNNSIGNQQIFNQNNNVFNNTPNQNNYLYNNTNILSNNYNSQTNTQSTQNQTYKQNNSNTNYSNNNLINNINFNNNGKLKTISHLNKNNLQILERSGDNSKAIMDSNFSPMTTSRLRLSPFHSKQIDFIRGTSKDGTQVNKISEFNPNANQLNNQLNAIQQQNAQGQGQINQNQEQFMINNLDKQKIFKQYFKYNNFDKVIQEYELVRPRFKEIRSKKSSQYFLFPLYTKKFTKIQSNTLINSPQNQYTEQKINMTFMDNTQL